MTTSRSYCSLCVLLLCCISITSGCGSSYNQPPVDPDTAVDAIIAQLDKDGDGILDEEELAGSPALLAERPEYDLNGDKKVTREELLERITAMYARNIAYKAAGCNVTLDGKPLTGATVKYIPEAYLGEGTTNPGEGVTDDSGFAKLGVPVELMPADLKNRSLMQVGIFKVEITHPTIEIPAKYNTETTLGFELHPDRHLGPDGDFFLSSK